MSTLNVFALFHLNLAFSSIEEEQRKPSSDDLSIKQLKLKKLYLKEEIERLRHDVH